MKLHSILLVTATALMLPVGGAFIAQNGLLNGTASAEPSGSALNLLAQSTPPDQMPTQDAPDREPGSAPEGRMRHKRMGGEWQKELNLTPEQQAQIKTIREQEETASEGLRQQMRTAREKLDTLMVGNASDGQLRQEHDQMQQLMQQLSARRFDTMLKVRSVLTPEQRAKSVEMRKQHKGRRQGDRNQARGMMPDERF
jgi:periplasmic protein CpxP/Spy